MMAKAAALLLLLAQLFQYGTATVVRETSLGGNLYLVNRTYRLTRAYAPDDLVTPKVRKTEGGLTLRREAAARLEEMFAAAKEAGHSLVAVSGYRSYDRQAAIYRRKVSSAGGKAAQLLVAPPGASEHQLGLAVDVSRSGTGGLNGAFGRSKEGRWLSENAPKFGFVVRYQARWTDITGYADEPWHIRYLGAEHAQAATRMDIPLETYVDILMKQHFGAYLDDGQK